MERDESFEPTKKKLKSPVLSDRLEDPSFQDLFQSNWHAKKPVITPDFEIIPQPFRVCRIFNFISSESLIDDVKNELLDVKTRRNCIDLYQFEQTEDLANTTSKHIERLYNAFKTDLTSWMQLNTKIELSGKMSMSSACYSDTDYLLCHDDNLGDRRIAYVLYLSKNWTEEDGGALDLFDTDENNQPNNIVRSLVPEYNSLVFFEVVDNSFHQVAEVTSLDKSRWTINGWFHGPLPEVKKTQRPMPVYRFFEPEERDVDLVSWVSKTYLIQDIVKEIQKAVEQDSFIYLPNFLTAEKCGRINEEIKGARVRWEKVGPADLRNYEVAEYRSLPEALREFLDLFSSIHVFHLLKQYTELDLVPEREDMKPRMRMELQRWSQGCYTLINDKQMGNYERDVKEDESERPKNEKEVKNAHDHGKNFVGKEEEKTKNTDEDDRLQGGKKGEKSLKNSDKKEERKDRGVDDEISEDKEKQKKNKSYKQKNDDKAGNIKDTSNERASNALKGKEQDETPRQRRSNKIPNSSETTNQKMTKLKSAKGKGKMVVSPYKNAQKRPIDTDDSEVSDIGDYLSDSQNDSEIETSENDDEDGDDTKPGTLDVLLQFHTENATEDATIDYVAPAQKDGALIHVPPQDNHLCLVYRTAGTSRCNKYVNHYCKGYFYTLVCSYYE